MEVLDSMPVDLEPEKVMKLLRLRRQSNYLEQMVRELVEVAQPIARPKVVYEVSHIDGKDKDSVEIDGVRFTSCVLRINLDKAERVFPYIATCGTELDEIAVADDDFTRYFCLDVVKTVVLGAAMTYFSDYLTRHYALGEMSHMNPGSLDSWPVTQQKELFSIFGNVEGLIGVRLTEGYAMVPTKSVSGIYFPSETRFESCQLCPRDRCVGRRAPYDAELAKQYEFTPT